MSDRKTVDLLLKWQIWIQLSPKWFEHRWFVYRGWVKLVFSPQKIFPIDQKKKKKKKKNQGQFILVFLFCQEILCCVYSLELHRRGDFNENTQQTIIL